MMLVAASRIVAEEQGRPFGFYVEVVIVSLALGAVAAYLGALAYVIFQSVT